MNKVESIFTFDESNERYRYDSCWSDIDATNIIQQQVHSRSGNIVLPCN